MKIKNIEELSQIMQKVKSEGKKVVLCHGCFDLMHPGHIKYFQAAKKMGDVLAVTITPDRYIDKGPGRPVFNENLRAESIAALECVDYVAVNKWPTKRRRWRLLRPNKYMLKARSFRTLRIKQARSEGV